MIQLPGIRNGLTGIQILYYPAADTCASSDQRKYKCANWPRTSPLARIGQLHHLLHPVKLWSRFASRSLTLVVVSRKAQLVVDGAMIFGKKSILSLHHHTFGMSPVLHRVLMMPLLRDTAMMGNLWSPHRCKLVSGQFPRVCSWLGLFVWTSLAVSSVGCSGNDVGQNIVR